MSTISILHLSDIHFKKREKEGFRYFQQDVIEKMITAISKHVEEYRVPDFAAITGDISFDGKNYERAKRFFDELKKILPETVFLPVPGNHDVDRDEVFKYFSLHDIVINKKTAGFLENKKHIKIFIISKFKRFKTFANNLNQGLYNKDNGYFWVMNIEDKRISFVGLNSAWACESETDRNNITLGFPQVKEALERSKDIPNRILLMHHPVSNWLNERDFSSYKTKIFKNFSLILHGHNHTDEALVYKSPDHSSICIGINASYTLDEDGSLGFQFIDADFAEKVVTAKVYPYIFNKKRNGFVPDRERYEMQEGEKFFIIRNTEETGNKSLINIKYDDIKNKTFLYIDIDFFNLGSLESLKEREELKDLEELILTYNSQRIANITTSRNNILSKLRELTLLDLSHKGISDLGIFHNFFRELINLKILYLNNNNIEDISILKELKNLEILHLYCNKIEDISILKELENLKILDFSNNRIVDIGAFKKLKRLKELYLTKNPIDESRCEINALKNELPDCEIKYVYHDNPYIDIDKIKKYASKKNGDSSKNKKKETKD